MPLMKGVAPIRRTLRYLNNSNLVLKDRIRILTINYNTSGSHHQGTRDFVFWTLPKLQYKNPNVQIVSYKNMTPSPFITCFLDDAKEVLVDLDSKTRQEIEVHLQKVLCKDRQQLKALAMLQEKKENPANFGFQCDKNCICIIPGQVPCPGVVRLPYHMRGRMLFLDKFDDDVGQRE